MFCVFCRFGAAPKFPTVPAEYVVDGLSVCEDHVDAVSGAGFGPDLIRFQAENP